MHTVRGQHTVDFAGSGITSDLSGVLPNYLSVMSALAGCAARADWLPARIIRSLLNPAIDVYVLSSGSSKIFSSSGRVLESTAIGPSLGGGLEVGIPLSTVSNTNFRNRTKSGGAP